MGYASSALRTCRDARSTSEYTATAEIPISWQARITRTAISPRFAMRIFLNILQNSNFTGEIRRIEKTRTTTTEDTEAAEDFWAVDIYEEKLADKLSGQD